MSRIIKHIASAIYLKEPLDKNILDLLDPDNLQYENNNIIIIATNSEMNNLQNDLVGVLPSKESQKEDLDTLENKVAKLIAKNLSSEVLILTRDHIVSYVNNVYSCLNPDEKNNLQNILLHLEGLKFYFAR